MTEKVYKILLEKKRNQEALKNLLGNYYVDTDYVCTFPDGKVITPNYLTKTFHSTIIKSDLPPVRLHDLRHSCASYLASKGFQLKDIQEWLGHADIETTANIYAHLYADRKDQILTSMNLMSY